MSSILVSRAPKQFRALSSYFFRLRQRNAEVTEYTTKRSYGSKTSHALTVMLRLPALLIAGLDKLALDQEPSRSDVLRTMLAHLLSKSVSPNNLTEIMPLNK
jgi:hypothetical protein